MSNIPCKRCNGIGKEYSNHYNMATDCPRCLGLGYFEPYTAELEAYIREQIIVNGWFNKAYTAPKWADVCQGKERTVEHRLEMQRRCRTYYVWRMTRDESDDAALFFVANDPLLAKTLAESPLDVLANRLAKLYL